MEQTIDSQLLLRYMRYLIELDLAARAGRPPGQRLPVFVDLEQLIRQILPAVEAAYDVLATVSRLWAANGIDQVLASTPVDQPPLGQGTIAAGEWLALQRVFRALPAMLETPILLPDDPEGTTPGPIPIAVISQRGR